MTAKAKTLRHTYPVNKYPNTRKYIQLVKELGSITRRAKNLVEQIGELEFNSRAPKNHIENAPKPENKKEDSFNIGSWIDSEDD